MPLARSAFVATFVACLSLVSSSSPLSYAPAGKAARRLGYAGRAGDFYSYRWDSKEPARGSYPDRGNPSSGSSTEPGQFQTYDGFHAYESSPTPFSDLTDGSLQNHGGFPNSHERYASYVNAQLGKSPARRGSFTTDGKLPGYGSSFEEGDYPRSGSNPVYNSHSRFGGFSSYGRSPNYKSSPSNPAFGSFPSYSSYPKYGSPLTDPNLVGFHFSPSRANSATYTASSTKDMPSVYGTSLTYEKSPAYRSFTAEQSSKYGTSLAHEASAVYADSPARGHSPVDRKTPDYGYFQRFRHSPADVSSSGSGSPTDAFQTSFYKSSSTDGATVLHPYHGTLFSDHRRDKVPFFGAQYRSPYDRIADTTMGVGN